MPPTSGSRLLGYFYNVHRAPGFCMTEYFFITVEGINLFPTNALYFPLLDFRFPLNVSPMFPSAHLPVFPLYASLFLSYIILNPSRVKRPLTLSIVSDSEAINRARPPVAITFVFSFPNSFFMRLTI